MNGFPDNIYLGMQGWVPAGCCGIVRASQNSRTQHSYGTIAFVVLQSGLSRLFYSKPHHVFKWDAHDSLSALL